MEVLTTVTVTAPGKPRTAVCHRGERGMAVSGNTDLFLIKTDSNGDTLWTKTIALPL